MQEQVLTKRVKTLRVLCGLAVALALVVVILGAFTRLVDAGLGCPDWPGCYGHLTWPTSADDVARAQARFPETPVEHDKTWPEMVHRYAAGLLGLLILAMTLLSWRARVSEPSVPRKLPLALLVLVIVQAAFGMWTVTLKLWPQVVTAHLLGGFATVSLLWLLLQRLWGWQWQVSDRATLTRLTALRGPAILAVAVVVGQILLGGWTSSNYAAVACPDFPKCHGEWWPPADYRQGFNFFQSIGPNYLGGLLDNHARTAIHFAHRLGALAVTAVLVWLMVALWRSGYFAARRMALVTLLAWITQVGLGISNVIWVLPLPVAVAHNAGGAALLLVMVTLCHRVFQLRREPSSAAEFSPNSYEVQHG